MLFSLVKISCFRAKVHLVFHWCLYNKELCLAICKTMGQLFKRCLGSVLQQCVSCHFLFGERFSTPFNVTVLVAHIRWTRKAFVFFKESSKEGIRRAKDFLNSCRSWTSFKQPTQRVYSTVQKKCKRNSVFFVLCSRENSTKFHHEISSKRSRIFVESNEISQSSWRNFASTEAKFRFAVISPRNSENSHSRNFARAKIRSCEISTKRNFAGSGGGL